MPVTLGVIAVLLIACIMTAICGMMLSKRKKTTWNPTNEQSTSKLKPLPTDDLLLQTINDR